VQVATNSDAPPPPEQAVEPPDLVAIELGPNNQIDIVITGKNNIRFQIPASGPGQWDFIRMSSEIEKLKARWPKLEEVNVKSDPTIEYKQVIRVIENLKKVIPKVFLGE
jgi:biopolymer transport protein ExbD